jgi:S-DNA-T family DNA segregation ATPase FtsK/SpoIIIE
MTARPEVPEGRIRIEEPPRLPTSEGAGGVAMSAIPMLGSLGSVVLVASLGGGSSEVRVVAAGLFLLSTVAYLAFQLDRQRGQRRRQLTSARRGYLRHLAGVRVAVRDAARSQRHALEWLHPDPSALPVMAADGTRVWERQPDDPDFLQVRYGVAAQPLSVELAAPADLAGHDVDPAAASAVRRLLETHRTQPCLPVAVGLRGHRRIALVGPAATTRGLARALMCSGATFHSPDHLVVAVLATEETLGEWEWVKWLPHAQRAERSDAVGPVRLVSTSAAHLTALLPDSTHLLLVLDGSALPDLDGRRAVTVVEVGAGDDAPTFGTLRLDVDGEDVRVDDCDRPTAEAAARRLLARRLPATGPEAGPATPRGLPELLGLDGLGRFDPATRWGLRPTRDRLRVPIGTGRDGTAVHLDLKESAHGGVGPHGLVVGATGSGK